MRCQARQLVIVWTLEDIARDEPGTIGCTEIGSLCYLAHFDDDINSAAAYTGNNHVFARKVFRPLVSTAMQYLPHKFVRPRYIRQSRVAVATTANDHSREGFRRGSISRAC